MSERSGHAVLRLSGSTVEDTEKSAQYRNVADWNTGNPARPEFKVSDKKLNWLRRMRQMKPAPIRNGLVILAAVVAVVAALVLVLGQRSTNPLTPSSIAVEYTLQILAVYLSIAVYARKWTLELSEFYWQIPASVVSFIISIALSA